MKKFFDLDGHKIPARSDDATEIWLERDGQLEKKPLAMLLTDGAWAVEGRIFEFDQLGTVVNLQITHIEYTVEMHQKRGRYGQLRRRVFAIEIPKENEFEVNP